MGCSDTLARLHKRAGRNVAAGAENEPYNTHPVLYTKFVSRLYRAGRTYLLKVPKVAVTNEGIEPGDMVEVGIRRLESKHGRRG